MGDLINTTERGTRHEFDAVGELASLWEKSTLSLEERLVSLGLFMRRQELSYLLANYELFKKIAHVKGSIFYFGVYHGARFMTLANMSAALEPYNHTRELIGFDTFAGYPEISDIDRSHGREYRTLVEGGFASDSREFLEHIIELYDDNRPLNHIPKIKLVEGDVCETLPEYLAQNEHTVASMIVLTMNLYEPTRVAIEQLWPRIPKGGIIAITALNEEYYPGSTRALLDVIGFDRPVETLPFAPNLAYVTK